MPPQGITNLPFPVILLAKSYAHLKNAWKVYQAASHDSFNSNGFNLLIERFEN
jgi:hypothetical protein